MKDLYILIIAFILVSCAHRSYMQGYDQKQVRNFNNVSFIEPVVSITEIDEKYQNAVYKYDEELKTILKTEYSPITNQFGSSFIPLDSIPLGRNSILQKISLGFNSDTIPDSSRLAFSFLKNQSTKVVFTYIDAFYKTDKLVNWESTKSVLWAIFTLGTYVPIYREYGVNYYAVMLDLGANRVVYKERFVIYEDPRQPQTYTKIVKKAYKEPK